MSESLDKFEDVKTLKPGEKRVYQLGPEVDILAASNTLAIHCMDLGMMVAVGGEVSKYQITVKRSDT